MADISVTPASVLRGTGTAVAQATAGETITAGQPIYLDSGDSNKAKLCSTASAAAANCVGVALHGATAGQPLLYASGGDVTYNAVLTVGEVYFVSANPGGIAPSGDAGAGEYVTVIGVAKSTTVLHLTLYATGATVAA